MANKQIKRQLKKPVQKNSKQNNTKDYELWIKDYDLPKDATEKAILHKMMELLEFYAKIVQQILQPEEFFSLHECSAFSEDDKKKLFDIYKKILVIHRGMLKAEIINSGSLYPILSSTHKEMLLLKPQIVDIIQKMQDSWTLSHKKDTVKYFG